MNKYMNYQLNDEGKLLVTEEITKPLGSWEELDSLEKEYQQSIANIQKEIDAIQAKKAEIEKLKPVWESEKGIALLVSERVEPTKETFVEPAELSNEEVII